MRRASREADPTFYLKLAEEQGVVTRSASSGDWCRVGRADAAAKSM